MIVLKQIDTKEGALVEMATTLPELMYDIKSINYIFQSPHPGSSHLLPYLNV